MAQGDTSRFDQVLSQYEHAPAVTRERMYLETMENVYKNSRKVIVDTKGGNSMHVSAASDKLIAPDRSRVSNPERYDDRGARAAAAGDPGDAGRGSRRARVG